MKDVTSTSFGLVIAFFLPGLAAFYSLRYWSCDINQLFKAFLTAESNLILFLLVAAGALIIGLQIAALRWLLFEEWLCLPQKLELSSFEKLGAEAKLLMAFRAVVDEHYRYHQFWGGTFIVIPILAIGLIKELWSTPKSSYIFLVVFVSVFSEWVTYKAAVMAYERYCTRAKTILEGGK